METNSSAKMEVDTPRSNFAGWMQEGTTRRSLASRAR